MKKTKLVCSECGGTNIQVQAWVDANTNEYKGDVDENGRGYCEDCDDEVRITDEKWSDRNRKVKFLN